MKIGIVGVGQFGRGFIRLFQKHPLVERIALCDVQVERLASCAREFGIAETYDSLDAICRSNLDALAIITQPWLHAPQVVQAMEAGKHVYSAVPVAYNNHGDGDEVLEWCDRIIATCRRTGLHYMMGETSYYRPEAMYCRRRAAAGDFGRFVHADGVYYHDVDLPGCTLWDLAKARRGAAWTPDQTGGVPMHYPTHSLGGFLSVMSARVTHVAAMGFHDPDDDFHRADTESGNVFGNETALLRLSNDATATIKEFRKAGTPGHEGFSLLGTKSSFIDNFGHCQWVTTEPGATQQLDAATMRDPLPEEVAHAFRDASGQTAYGGHGGSHAYLVHEFVDAVAHDRTPAINAWEAVRYLAPGIVAHQSALRDGELLKVPDWGDGPA